MQEGIWIKISSKDDKDVYKQVLTVITLSWICGAISALYGKVCDTVVQQPL